MKRKIFMKTAGARPHSTLARVMTAIVMMLTLATNGAWADDVLYATVSGTEMTLKYGTLPSGAFQYDGYSSWANAFQSAVTTATVDESCKNYAGTTLAHLFRSMSKLTAISGLENLNTASATSMHYMFYRCTALTSLDLSGWNTAEATSMYSMFCGCTSLTSLDLSGWNTAEVTAMNSMFYECPALTSVDLSGWNTAKVTNMSFMFENCTSLETITVGSGWNTNAVITSSYMFYGCEKLPNYNSSVNDKTNAHTGEGGYLTAAAPAGYTVTWAEGTGDQDNWKISKSEGLSEGEEVTVTYEGNRRVKSVTATWTPAAPAVWDGDLSKLTGSEPEGYATATDGMTIFNTLADGVKAKVIIADKATVTLDGATLNGTDSEDCKWAGLTIEGDATIILKDDTESTIKGFYRYYPGIYVPENKTLTIQGTTGSLTASSNGCAPGIGAGGRITGSPLKGGNIVIEGGIINATGGKSSAGIGASSNCGNITITGGTVTAKGGDYAAGIGRGSDESICGNITIANTVTKVTATKGNYCLYSIWTSGTVTIGCTLDTDGNPVGGNVGAISTSPYTYQP